MRRAVLLDALGTLVELEPPAPTLRRLLRERFGIALSDEQAGRAIRAEIAFYRAHLAEGRDAESVALLRGRCAGALREALAAEALLDRLDLAALTAALLDSLVFRPFPEVPETLRRLRAMGLRLVVASNWDASLPETLGRLGIARLLDGVVTSAAAGAAKPDRAIFEAALQRAGVAAAEAVHVGDSVVEDVEGARRAGVAPILVHRGGRARAADPPAAAAGVRVIESLSELPGLLAVTP